MKAHTHIIILLICIWALLCFDVYLLTRPAPAPGPVFYSVARVEVNAMTPAVINLALGARRGWEPFALSDCGKYVWIKQ